MQTENENTMYSIYKITNIVNNKLYVGQTKRSLIKRWKSHVYESSSKKYDMYLHNSIRKHGSEKFKIELIEECSKDNVYERERYWIQTLNSKQPYGYNEHEGGKGGCLNPTDELRAKLSLAKKGKYIPWNKGLTKDDPRVSANGKAVSAALKGKPKSENHKESMRKPKQKRKCFSC